MKIVGVIAEYNPFHQGHACHLKKARLLSEADYVIVAMSGNYVQRGGPAMFDKYTRAKAALLGGADLVLELPPAISVASAEYFASGAVRLLADTGVVTDLCFGSECGRLSPLEQTARLLAEEPTSYKEVLKKALRLGEPYPKARAQALSRCGSPEIPPDLLDHPNNLLAVEYLKALLRLKSPIRPHTLKRTGAPYHGQQLLDHAAASATGIRQALAQSRGAFTDTVRKQLPFSEIYEDYDGRPPMTEDAFSLLLLERLRRDPSEDFSSYFDVPEALANRIRSCLADFRSFSQFTDLVKTRNFTRTAVSRALLHILLQIRTWEPAGQLRILGFRKSAEPLLKELSSRSPLPMVTAPRSGRLPADWLYADRLYESVRSLLQDRPFMEESQRKMLVIEPNEIRKLL